VVDDLDDRIPLVVDAGPTAHGIESTIVSVGVRRIDILRQGPITAEQLSPFAKIEIAPRVKKVSAPGQLPSHYAPKTALALIDSHELFSLEKNQRVGLLAWNAIAKKAKFAAIRHLSERQDFREAATNLFRYLRELDALNLDLIVAERVPSRGLGAAITERLERASNS
jgi:L-threonylcarbamoyladenylate synthase